MIARATRRLGRWPWLESLLQRALGRASTWPAEDFSRFTRARLPGQELERGPAALPPPAEPAPAPEAVTIAPATFELRFAGLQRDGRYEEMWDLLAHDAQRSWGGRGQFVESFRRQAGLFQLIEAEVGECRIVPEWTDAVRRRRYRNVAELTVRYRVRREHSDLTLDRSVHLVPAAGGWRTLCFPE